MCACVCAHVCVCVCACVHVFMFMRVCAVMYNRNCSERLRLCVFSVLCVVHLYIFCSFFCSA